MLKTKVTDKDIFLKVKDHLLTQNARSVDDAETCKYRCDALVSIDTETGEEIYQEMKCAVGAVIDDQYYNPSIEYKGVFDIGVTKAIRLSNQNWVMDDKSFEMLHDLQEIHDKKLPESWDAHLDENYWHFNLDGQYLGK